MKNILEFLEKTAEKHFNKVAVDDGSICLTWAELRDLARRIGTAFGRKTKPGEPIVLLMEKNAATLAFYTMRFRKKRT